MRSVRVATVLVSVLALVVGLFSVGSASAKTKITPRNFGIHSYTTDPGVPAGTLRMNCSPGWRQVQPRPGVYHWKRFDEVVDRAERWGFTDIVYVFCATPRWAARKVADPSREVLGRGSTGAPRKMKYWRQFVAHVVKRYQGRIDYFQVWNEITSPQFYQGTPKQMTAMTVSASRIVRKYGGGAKLVAASVQTHVPRYFRDVAVPYFRGLKKKHWPVKVLAGHFYPAGKGGPNQRDAQIRMFQKTLRKLHAPKRIKRWDTEGNFWTGVPGNPRKGRVRGKRAAAYVARNYLDAWRLGIVRSYWYLWSDSYVPFAGVQLREGDPGTAAYQRLGLWTIGATMGRCTKGRLVVCSFRKGKKFVIAYTLKGKARLKISHRRSVCPVSSSKCKTARKKVRITTIPVRIA